MVPQQTRLEIQRSSLKGIFRCYYMQKHPSKQSSFYRLSIEPLHMSPVDRACQVTAISATQRDHMKRLHVQLPFVSQEMSILRQRKRIFFLSGNLTKKSLFPYKCLIDGEREIETLYFLSKRSERLLLISCIRRC